MLPKAEPSHRGRRHRAAVNALRAIIPSKYLVAHTSSQNLAAATLSYLQFLQSGGLTTTSLTLLELVQTLGAVGGTQISTSARMEQEVLAFEAAKRRIVKLKQIRRKIKNTEMTEVSESENPNSEESMDHSGNSDQSLVHDEAVYHRVNCTNANDTEEDDSEVENSVEMDNEREENEVYDDNEDKSAADSNATAQSSNNENKRQENSGSEAYTPLYQMGCRELLPGENAIAIGLGPKKEHRKVVLRVVCTELLELQLRGVRATILLPESFLAVEFDDVASKDRALGILRRSLSNLDLADRTNAHETSDVDSSAGSNEAVHDGHR
jgi:hypothetical protein